MAAINNSGTINNTTDTTQTLAINNTGVINVTGGTFELANTLTGSAGTINISSHGTLQLDTAASGNTISFGDATGGLTIEQLASFGATMHIVGLQAGDKLSIPHLPAGFKENYSATTGTLTLTNAVGTSLGTIVFTGGQLPAASVVQNAVVLCFASGTRIATPDGERRVEALRPGDRVRLRDGGAGAIEWSGRRRIDCARHPHPELVRPYRIAALAFGPDAPRRDLLLSPDHAVFVDGVLIPVKHLANGTTIRQVDVAAVTYHHVALREHAIILAEGLTVETLLPCSDISGFESGPGPIRLHPDFSVRNWDALGCAPLVVTGPLLRSVRGRLAQRAAAAALDPTASAVRRSRYR